MPVRKIKDTNIDEINSVFFDANIWIMLKHTHSQQGKKRVKKCSTFYKSLLENKKTIYINEIILSEVANSIARIEFYKFNVVNQNKYTKFKDYRESDDYPPVAKKISIILENIMKSCTILDYTFTKNTMQQIIEKFKINADFNDLLTEFICKNNNIPVLTNDKDFKQASCDVITLV